MSGEDPKEALTTEVSALQAEIDRLHDSLAMRIGRLAIEAVRSPRGGARLPIGLFALLRTARFRLAWRSWVLALECGLPDDPLRGANPSSSEAVAMRSAGKAALAGRALPRNLTFSSGAARSAANRHDKLHGAVPGLPVDIGRRRGGEGVLMILHAGQPDIRNGYARRSHELARALRADGCDVTACLRTGHRREDIAVDSVPYMRLRPFPQGSTDLDDYVSDYADAVVDIAERSSPAILHAASNHVTGMATAIAARRLGLPFIYEVRGLWEVTRCSVEPRYAGSIGYDAQRRRELAVASAADVLLVNGSPIGRVFESSGIAKEKISVVPNGCDVTRFDQASEKANDLARAWSIPERTPIVGFVGSLTPYEGLSTLLRACAAQGRFPWHLLVVGDGPSSVPLRALAAELRITERVTFTGAVDAEDAAAAYDLIDIAPIVRTDTPVARLVPPLKPLEAMAGKAAMIVSDLPPLVSFAEDGRGRIVPPGDHKSLARTIDVLLDASEDRRAMVHRARSWVEDERSWQAIAARVRETYDHLAA